jgi:hypothetical protein
MLRSSLRCVLFILVLGFCAASVPAQELEMRAPPIPSVIPPPPPDPDTLPPPPQLQWAPLVPKGAEAQQPPGEVLDVPPPDPEPSIAPPPPPVIETVVPGLPDPAQVELLKPDVEIWRQQSESPQVPARQINRLDQAFVTGTEPVTLRVQFNPAAAGKHVYVRPGRGLSVGINDGMLTVSSAGECLVTAQIDEGVSQSHIIFYCEGVKTVLPVRRASLATVIEAEDGGGR